MPQFKPPSADEKEFIDAEALFLSKNYQDAYLRLLPLAHRGNAKAQYYLALMSDNGVGPVQRDIDEGLRWYRLAAAQNHPEAQFALSNAYAIGRGVAQNPEQMMHWLRKAAENQYMPAMIAMAAVLDRGLGVPFNPVEGSAWIKKAAELGSVDATYEYARRLNTGFGAEKNEREAMEWFKFAALRGHPGAQLLLGSIAEGSVASPETNVESLVWLNLAAQRGQGEVRTMAQQAQRELQKNMMPSEIAEAQTRARAWKPIPGVRPDPIYDAPADTASKGGAPARRGGG
jgi:uncharacterized protein